jgi:pimeloyl-ACP methyl ester carboxylesterase
MAAEWGLSKGFDYDGQSVAYDVLGEGDPIVLVHGTPFSSYVWRNIVRELARDVSLGVQNAVLAALLRYWSLERPKVIAHDFGGATALRAHLLDGCEYDKLLLFDPVAIRPWGSPFVQHVRKFEAAFAGVPDDIQRAILKAYIRGAISRPISDAELEPYIAPWIGPVGQPAFYRQLAQMDVKYTDEVQGEYGNIRCPVKLLWGTDDNWIPVERGHELAAMIPNCDYTEIPGCGHLMQEDSPEAIVAAAMRFFAGS